MKKFLADFKKRDIVVALIAILAVVVLALVMKITKKQEKMAQEELIESGIESIEAEKEEKPQQEDLGNLVINEVSSEGAVEIFNNKQENVDISGYIVRVGGKDTVIPDGTVLEVSGIYTVETKERFDEDNNVVMLFDKDNTLVRAISFDALDSGKSFGCLTDGSVDAGYITSTAGKSNEGSSFAKIDDLVFSVPAGFYDESFELEIYAPEGYKVYYTVDGSVPTVDSQEYTERINISRPSGKNYVYATSDGNGYTYTETKPKTVDMGTVVKAIAVDKDGNVAFEKTVPYFIGYRADSDYLGLSVISIEADPAELFGFDHGIYVPGKTYYTGYVQKNGALGNYRNGKTAKVQFEYYEDCKDMTYSSNATIGIINDGRIAAAQKALALNVKDVYPNGTSIDGFLNSSSKTLRLLTGDWDSESKIRNYFVNGLVEGTSIVTKDYKPCIVFINGEFWGLYTLATSYDASFFERKLGIEDDVIAVTTSYKEPEEYSEFYNYVVNTDFSIAENYQALQDKMDVSNYIEFMCTNIFIGNTALGRHNSTCVWRTVGNSGTGYSDGRWRWALGDVSSTLGNVNSFLDPYTKGSYSDRIINTYLSSGVRDNAFFNSLIKSDAFCDEYLKTMDRLMESNLNQENANRIVREIRTSIFNAVKATGKRFSSGGESSFNYDATKISNFFAVRNTYLQQYTEEYIGNKGKVPGLLSSSEESSDEQTDNELPEEMVSED